ncbi:hypothetical protein [Nonomuraea sp. NPDC005650]|uniref:hypothetical protein n=1 Tax=Nonomuraea sp. NPDC005650 TaxID=3157045 RepID=UPI0033B7BD9E
MTPSHPRSRWFEHDRFGLFVHFGPYSVAGRIRFARLLHDGSEVRFTQIPPDQQANTMTPAGPPPGTATLLMPVQRPDVLLPAVEVVLEEP